MRTMPLWTLTSLAPSIKMSLTIVIVPFGCLLKLGLHPEPPLDHYHNTAAALLVPGHGLPKQAKPKLKALRRHFCRNARLNDITDLCSRTTCGSENVEPRPRH